MAVPAAMHNSGEVERSPCHKNSQVAVCKRLMNWLVANENKKRLMVWVYGDSNTGKSTITQTLAMWCFQEGYLLGSFFFTKTDPQRSTYKYFAATLAYQVATVVPALKERISAAVEHDPLIFDKSLETQVNALIIDPINSLCSITAGIVPHVILIDGLDECLGWKKQCYVLEALSAAIPRCKIPLRVLIASRPETEIKLAFNSYPLQSFSTKFTLDNSFQSGADKLRFPDPLEEIETRHQVNANISAVNPGVKKVGKCFIVLTMILKTWNIGINQYYSSRFSFNPRRIEETTLPIAANSPRSQWGETLTGTRSISTIVLTSSISLITYVHYKALFITY